MGGGGREWYFEGLAMGRKGEDLEEGCVDGGLRVFLREWGCGGTDINLSIAIALEVPDELEGWGGGGQVER